MKKDVIEMSQKDRKRLHIVRKTLENSMTQVKAAEVLELSLRQIQRLSRRIKEEGDIGIIHRSRGRVPGNAFLEAFKAKILSKYKSKYLGFGSTLAAEKLLEKDQILISKESLRQLLLKKGLIERTRKINKRHKKRERKAYTGEMVQMDGSHHDWFEGRGEKAVLMAMIDDATSEAYFKFYKYEGTFPAMDCFRNYVKKQGLPLSVYVDQHTTYKSPKKPTIEDELKGIKPMSHFQRALVELEVSVIHAQSPQAKGRVERLFKTLQDRLVKEMRLEKVSTIKEANHFLKKYRIKFNKKFAVMPAKSDDVHQKCYGKSNLENALAKKFSSTLRNDRTIVHDKKWYQIETITPAKKVTLALRYDGKTFINYKGKKLRFKSISKPNPIKKQAQTSKSYKGHKPSKNNMFNKYYTFSKRDLIQQLKEKMDERSIS